MSMTNQEAIGYKMALVEIDKKMTEIVTRHMVGWDDDYKVFLHIQNDITAFLHRELYEINIKLDMMDEFIDPQIKKELDELLDS